MRRLKSTSKATSNASQRAGLQAQVHDAGECTGGGILILLREAICSYIPDTSTAMLSTFAETSTSVLPGVQPFTQRDSGPKSRGP